LLINLKPTLKKLKYPNSYFDLLFFYPDGASAPHNSRMWCCVC